jgi:DNA polymerase-4
VEALSLDEAFLDVTASQTLHGPAESIARQIKDSVRSDTHLVASVGVAPNKFLAKLASDQNKPDGLCVVAEADRQQFLDPLPVTRIWGIGRKAGSRLESIGVRTVRQLRISDPLRLSRILGRQVDHFLALAQGIDDREVIPLRGDKSISHEVTLDQDLTRLADCRKILLDLSGRVGLRLRNKGLVGRTITIKVRTSAFRTFTRSHTLAEGTADDRNLYRQACQLMDQWWAELGPARIRLLGFGASGLENRAAGSLFADARGLDRVKDELRRRFGADAVKPATLIRPEEDD